MAAPFEFDGETITDEAIASKASIADADIAGDYQFMRHQYGQNTKAKAFETPVNITLNEDGTITGAENGTWKRTAGTDYIHLTINNVVYRGVLVKQTIDYTNIPAIAISALSSSSGSLTIGQNSFTYQQEVWAVKADAKAAIKYTLNKMTLPFSDGAILNAVPTLPTQGKMGAKISWKSSDTSILTDDGKVKGKGKVTMTMTISKDEYEYVKDYTLNIDAEAEETTPVYYPVSAQKNTTSGWWSNFSSDYVLKSGKKAEFKFYNYSDEVNNWDNWALVAASASRGASNYAEYFVLRNDNYAWFTKLGGNTNENTANVQFTLDNNFDWTNFKQDMNGSLVDMVVEYVASGTIKVNATITKDKKTYNYTFSMTSNTIKGDVTLFFVNEKSYIDGSSLSTGISNPIIIQKKNDGKWFNLSGQQVDKSYKGVVIVNGKKFVNK